MTYQIRRVWCVEVDHPRTAYECAQCGEDVRARHFKRTLIRNPKRKDRTGKPRPDEFINERVHPQCF